MKEYGGPRESVAALGVWEGSQLFGAGCALSAVCRGLSGWLVGRPAPLSRSDALPLPPASRCHSSIPCGRRSIVPLANGGSLLVVSEGIRNVSQTIFVAL